MSEIPQPARSAVPVVPLSVKKEAKNFLGLFVTLYGLESGPKATTRSTRSKVFVTIPLFSFQCAAPFALPVRVLRAGSEPGEKQ